MPSLFVSKYEKNYRLESFREKMIQKIQAEHKCSREYAVRCYDYSKNYVSHESLKITSGLLFTYGAYKLNEFLASTAPIFKKSYMKFPVLVGGFLLGRTLYDKLSYYYLNPYNVDVTTNWEKDLASYYGVKYDDMAQKEINLTPFERMKNAFVNDLDSLNVEGEKTFKRLSKDKNDFYYLFGKIRNLENIIYLNPTEIEKINNPVELQMKIDQVKPELRSTGSMDKHVDSIHKSAEDYKYLIENSRNFRSIKDKFLGLPFMLKRHQQFPTPSSGTWQFDVYEQIFGERYDVGSGKAETEEKVNKYNYHLFLHPSVIAKYDTNSEEFDMFLRKLNVESNTVKELREKRREFFCQAILPVLNLTDSKEVGFDFANYVINKSKSDDYNTFLYDQYSGQKEEALFREAEEAKYQNKNEPHVQRVGYSTINKDRIGLRASEMNEILSNPTKFKK